MNRPYFAYGSNLWEPRLRRRVPGVGVLGAARATGFELRWHKRGRDGSGKCSIVPGGGDSVVHGAVFQMPPGQRHLLDCVEGLGRGYEGLRLDVATAGGLVEAWTYRAQVDWVDDALLPFAWYRDLVVAGAEAFGFPASYLEHLRSVPFVDDPDAGRAARNRGDLTGGPVS